MASYSVVQHEARPYAAIGISLPMAGLVDAVPLNGEVFAWLSRRDVPALGPPFWKYNVIDMAGELQLEVGVVTAAPIEGDGRVTAGELPAGNYLETTHHGHPDSLQQATADLLAYADEQDLRFDRRDSPAGDQWAARLEYYLTDPDDEPDMTQWDTTLSFKLAD
jgi:hypothetical protein